VSAIVQTPLLHGGEAIELSGGTWRKRVLPVGQVEYQGRMLQFDKDYLNDLAAAFNSRAYDQVPFQLATDDNKHNNNPEVRHEVARGEWAARKEGRLMMAAG